MPVPLTLSAHHAATGPRPTREAYAQRLPMDVVDVTPISESGAHLFYHGTLAASGTPVFIKHNTVGALFKHEPAALLNPAVKWARESQLPNLDRLQDMTEVVFSNFAKDYFERQGHPYSGLAYQEVFFTDPQTQEPHLCIAAPLIDNLDTLDNVPAKDVSNPREAVEQTLLRGLVMGDWNCTFRDQNVGVAKPDTTISDGRPLTPGSIIDMDFGDAGTRFIGQLGVPYGNRKLLSEYPEYVKPALDHIRNLDSQTIRQMIERAGAHVTGWTPELTDYYSGVLAGNLQHLSAKLEKDPDWLTGRHNINPMRQPGLSGIKQFIFRIPSDLRHTLPLKKAGILSHIAASAEVAKAIQSQKYPHQTTTTQPQ